MSLMQVKRFISAFHKVAAAHASGEMSEEEVEKLTEWFTAQKARILRRYP